MFSPRKILNHVVDPVINHPSNQVCGGCFDRSDLSMVYYWVYQIAHFGQMGSSKFKRKAQKMKVLTSLVCLKKSFPICDIIYIYLSLSPYITTYIYDYICIYVLIHIHLIYFHINRNVEIGVPIDLIIIFPIETPRLGYLHFKRNSVVHSCTISETSHHLCFLPEHFKISGWDSRY